MRLCHMVKFDRYILETFLNKSQPQPYNNCNQQQQEQPMKAFRSTPLPSVSRSLSCSSDFFVAQKQDTTHALRHLVYGRIQDNGVNFVVEGMRCGRWVQIPCRSLLDARLYLGEIMDKASFDFNKAQFGKR